MFMVVHCADQSEYHRVKHLLHCCKDSLKECVRSLHTQKQECERFSTLYHTLTNTHTHELKRIRTRIQSQRDMLSRLQRDVQNLLHTSKVN